MKKQIPRGDEDMNCPFHHLPMADVCHKCPLWTQVQGVHPQTEERVDMWNCTLAFLPMLLVNAAREAAAGAAATVSFRNMVANQAATRRQAVVDEAIHKAEIPYGRKD